MYRLVVIAGPNRGTAYPLPEGETIIGRVTGSGVVLASGKVSKRHCSFRVTPNGIELRDLGSSNGTFVNGALVKARLVKTGDKISVGDFVLEVRNVATRAPDQAPALVGLPGLSARSFPVAQAGAQMGTPGMPGAGGSPQDLAEAPKDLQGKALWMVEKQILPFFYGLNLKQEWRAMAIGSASVVLIGNMLLAMVPLLESSTQSILKESARRAQFMAKQIAEQNAQALAAQQETKTFVGAAEQADGVRVALLTDMSNRIIAPGSKQNQYLAAGVEAQTAVAASKAFGQGRETGVIQIARGENTVMAIEPVKVLDPRVGRNVVLAMAVVSIDTSLATPGVGTLGVAYSSTFILTALFTAIVGFILYRVTLKPLEVLNEDIDKVLKGELGQVTHEFKCEELDPLFDVVNSALQRIPKGADAAGIGGGATRAAAEDLVSIGDLMGQVGIASMLCDERRQIVHMNNLFEEMSGIRGSNSKGQEIAAVVRDQAFGALSKDLFDQIDSNSSAVISEEFEFSGINFKIRVAGLGGRGYLMTARRSESEAAAA